MSAATCDRKPAMNDRATQVLSDVFGFERFRPGQEQAIRQLLAGHSSVAIFPTGSGKSLCYQLPALLLEGLTVVISPLIALMKDQLDFLRDRKIPAARLDSSLDRTKRCRSTTTSAVAGPGCCMSRRSGWPTSGFCNCSPSSG